MDDRNYQISHLIFLVLTPVFSSLPLLHRVLFNVRSMLAVSLHVSIDTPRSKNVCFKSVEFNLVASNEKPNISLTVLAGKIDQLDSVHTYL